MIGAGNPGGLARRRRNILNPLAAGVQEIVVNSEEQFREAINVVASRSVFIKNLPSSGNVIVLGTSFDVRAPIVIPFNCSGLIIDGRGYLITCPVGLSFSLFKNNASFITIRDINVSDSPNGDGITGYFSAFVESFQASGFAAPKRFTVENCNLALDTIMLASDTDFIVIQNCYNIETLAEGYFIDLTNCESAIIANNTFRVGGLGTILRAGCTSCVFSGNTLSNSFNSSASAGFNTVIGNTGTAVITDRKSVV